MSQEPAADTRPIIYVRKGDGVNVIHYRGEPIGPPWGCESTVWQAMLTRWQCECPHFIYRDLYE